MNRSLAALFLCSSLIAGANAQGTGDKRMPWADKAQDALETKPLEKQSPKSLSDFQFGSSRGFESSQWVKDVADTARQQAIGGQEPAAADYDIQVFISAGMPEGVLRHLFAQAVELPPGRVRFVIRGFTPQKLGPLVAKLRSLFPDPHGDHIALEVDPNAFRTYRVEAVPVYLVREKDRWFEVQGAQSLAAAKENVRKRAKKVQGELYAIAEPDILSVIEERAKNFDWKPVLARAQARAARNLKPGFDLPTASKNATSYTVPTFTVPHDIRSPSADGKQEILLAKEGQVLRLLDHTRLQVPVIVFDPTDTRQVAMVRRWIAQPENKHADLFVVGGEGLQSRDPSKPATVELSEAFNRPVYPMLSKLSERFGVEAVPAIVDQEGARLRIRYFDPEAR